MHNFSDPLGAAPPRARRVRQVQGFSQSTYDNAHTYTIFRGAGLFQFAKPPVEIRLHSVSTTLPRAFFSGSFSAVLQPLRQPSLFHRSRVMRLAAVRPRHESYPDDDPRILIDVFFP
jgi:hypothetical protein